MSLSEDREGDSGLGWVYAMTQRKESTEPVGQLLVVENVLSSGARDDQWWVMNLEKEQRAILH